MDQYHPECIAVSQKSIDNAIDWLWTLERTKPVGQTSCCEAVTKALEDKQVCVYCTQRLAPSHQ